MRAFAFIRGTLPFFNPSAPPLSRIEKVNRSRFPMNCLPALVFWPLWAWACLSIAADGENDESGVGRAAQPVVQGPAQADLGKGLGDDQIETGRVQTP